MFCMFKLKDFYSVLCVYVCDCVCAHARAHICMTVIYLNVEFITALGGPHTTTF